MKLSRSPLNDIVRPVLVKAAVIENKPLSVGHFSLKLIPNALIPASYPGQFFMLGFPERMDPLLKRPFGYFRRGESTIEFLYRVRGKMTGLMSALREGEELEVFGPLGNFYPKPRRKTPLIIAGGIGIASLYPFIESLEGKAVVIYGGKGKNELVLANDLKERKLARELLLVTEDGSLGRTGTALALLKERLAAKGEKLGAKGAYRVYACGPKGMLKAISELGVEGYFSAEENMACGTGVCLGCAIKTARGYKRVCKDGPIFNLKEVRF